MTEVPREEAMAAMRVVDHRHDRGELLGPQTLVCKCGAEFFVGPASLHAQWIDHRNGALLDALLDLCSGRVTPSVSFPSVLGAG